MRGAYTIKLRGGRTVEALLEVFNITDHVNYLSDSYVTRYGVNNFGEPTQIVPNSERQAQFGVKFRF
jgi:hypothetical protein